MNEDLYHNRHYILNTEVRNKSVWTALCAGHQGSLSVCFGI